MVGSSKYQSATAPLCQLRLWYTCHCISCCRAAIDGARKACWFLVPMHHVGLRCATHQVELALSGPQAANEVAIVLTGSNVWDVRGVDAADPRGMGPKASWAGPVQDWPLQTSHATKRQRTSETGGPGMVGAHLLCGKERFLIGKVLGSLLSDKYAVFYVHNRMLLNSRVCVSLLHLGGWAVGYTRQYNLFTIGAICCLDLGFKKSC